METQAQDTAAEKNKAKKNNAPMVVPPVETAPPESPTVNNQLNVLIAGEPGQAPAQYNPALLIEPWAHPISVMSEKMARLEAKISEWEHTADKMAATSLAQSASSGSEDGILATMVGGIFNCPECGLRITSPALISTQGKLNGGYYEHPFDDSPRLAGQKCRLIGKKFQSPIVHLKFVETLTAKP